MAISCCRASPGLSALYAATSESRRVSCGPPRMSLQARCTSRPSKSEAACPQSAAACPQPGWRGNAAWLQCYMMANRRLTCACPPARFEQSIPLPPQPLPGKSGHWACTDWQSFAIVLRNGPHLPALTSEGRVFKTLRNDVPSFQHGLLHCENLRGLGGRHSAQTSHERFKMLGMNADSPFICCGRRTKPNTCRFCTATAQQVKTLT